MGGVASSSETNKDRRERLRQLALETIDIFKDPYFMKNHLGSFECKLCLTIHIGEGSYLAHTQGKRHQENLARRAAREKQQAALTATSTFAIAAYVVSAACASSSSSIPFYLFFPFAIALF